MSMPERSRGTARSGAARLRPLAFAGIAVALTASGCANYEVLKPYQPAAGVQTNAPGMMVRNLMLIGGEGDTAKISGTLIASAADELTSVTGTATKADGTTGSPLTVTSTKVTLPKNKPVDLGAGTTSVKGVTLGGMTSLTLNFAKSGPITLTVPVVSPTQMDISPASPAAAASNAG